MLIQAQKYFEKTDKTMARLLRAAPDLQLPSPSKPSEYFKTLASSINSQQISVSAAAAIWMRLEKGLSQVTPQNLLSKTDEELRSFGLSRQKARYMRSLAEHAISDPDFLNLHNLSDEDVIKDLTKIVGIGRWTAEMFLMFALARPDVFSYGDIGLLRGLEQNYNVVYKDLNAAKEIIEPLSPHRTTAALVLWHHKDGGPVVL